MLIRLIFMPFGVLKVLPLAKKQFLIRLDLSQKFSLFTILLINWPLPEISGSITVLNSVVKLTSTLNSTRNRVTHHSLFWLTENGGNHCANTCMAILHLFCGTASLKNSFVVRITWPPATCFIFIMAKNLFLHLLLT